MASLETEVTIRELIDAYAEQEEEDDEMEETGFGVEYGPLTAESFRDLKRSARDENDPFYPVYSREDDDDPSGDRASDE